MGIFETDESFFFLTTDTTLGLRIDELFDRPRTSDRSTSMELLIGFALSMKMLTCSLWYYLRTILLLFKFLFVNI